MEQREAAKQAKAALAELDKATSKGAGNSKKSSKKAKEAVAMADASDPNLQENFLLNLKKAKEDAEDAKGQIESATKKLFQFYTNLLSVEAKYTWDKVVVEQTASNPYTDLQGVSQKGPREPSHKSFDVCMLFHLLTMFPSNATEQERYCIMNVLKKPQCISLHQFVHHVEQLNSYIVQLPCFYNSPSVDSTTTLANIQFTRADLASHVLRMCPLYWQDQYSLHEKGITPFDMRLLLTSLEAIEHMCTHEKAKTQSSEKDSNKGEKGNKQPGTKSMARVPEKACTEKHCNPCKKHGGTQTMHNTRDYHKYEKDGKEKPNFCAAKKGGKKANLARQNFEQLSKKLDKLEKVLKKLSIKSKKRHYEDCDSNSEQEVGSGSIGKIVINLGETIKKTKFTPPSSIKANPTLIASNQDDICPTSFSNAGNVMLTSPSQKEGIHVNTCSPRSKSLSLNIE